MKPTEIIAIDWHVYRKFLLVWAAVLALGIFAAMLLPPGAQVAKGIFLGATLVCPYGFAHFCFVIPRGFGLRKRLLTPAHRFSWCWRSTRRRFPWPCSS